MRLRQFSLAVVTAASLVMLSAPSFAVPATDVHIEDLMAQAGDVKKMLNLTANQTTLWQQTEEKMKTIVRARLSRRSQLQTDLNNGVNDPKTELRDLSKKMQVEEDVSYQENKELRELWLTINDALDDKQRAIILDLLSQELQRSLDEKCPATHTKSDLPTRSNKRSNGMNSGGINVGSTPLQ